MRAVCALLLLLGAVLPRAAAAQTSTAASLRLDWRAPPGCPSARAVRAAALRNSGRPESGDSDGAPLEVRADVEHAARWRVTIRASRDGLAAETRSLEAASCGALAEATAVVLGVALVPAHTLARADGEAAAPGPPSATPEALAASATPAMPVTTPPAPSASSTTSPDRAEAQPTVGSPSRTHARLALGAELAGATGALPATTAGARVALAWTPGAFRVELSGAYFSGQSRSTEANDAGARFGLLTFGGRGCWAALRSKVEMGPCLGIDVEHMSADGFGAPTNYATSGTWSAGAVGLLVRLPLTSYFALRADLDGVAPFTRPRFVVENDGAVFKPAAVGARAGIGAELSFF